MSESSGRVGALWTWFVAVVFWLYYLTPLLAPGGDRPAASSVLLAVLTGLGAFVLLSQRRRFPVVVPVLIGCLLLLWPGATGAAFGAVAYLARYQRRPVPVILVSGWVLTMKVIILIVGPNARPWGSANTVELTISVGGLVIAVLVGALGGSREAESIERATAESARRDAEQARLDHARSAERERIAREMHDVLAHRLTLVAMHAGALAYRTDLDSETAQETAALIQRNAKQSLAELRMVLADLRGAGAAPEPPQPTLHELAALVSESSRQQRVDLDLGIDPDQVPNQLSRQAYRVIQEALTNARKHAPGAPVSVAVSGASGDQLTVQVSNPLTELALPESGGSGLGLLGITERAELVGGTARSGISGDRFQVQVVMPWREAS